MQIGMTLPIMEPDVDCTTLEAMLPVTGFAGTLAQLKRALDQLEDLGADEVHLIPTSDDVDQVARIARPVLVWPRWSGMRRMLCTSVQRACPASGLQRPCAVIPFRST